MLSVEQHAATDCPTDWADLLATAQDPSVARVHADVWQQGHHVQTRILCPSCSRGGFRAPRGMSQLCQDNSFPADLASSAAVCQTWPHLSSQASLVAMTYIEIIISMLAVHHKYDLSVLTVLC